jgi:hypothetical protein
MKFPNEKSRAAYQTMLEKELQMKTELKELENQIEDFESSYFEKTWNDGNITLGWSKLSTPPPPNNAPKIRLLAKDKIFSLSSTTSPVNHELGEIADKNLTPLPESRFQQSYSTLI